MMCKQCRIIWRENCQLTGNESATWFKECGACVGADDSLTLNCVPIFCKAAVTLAYKMPVIIY